MTGKEESDIFAILPCRPLYLPQKKSLSFTGGIVHVTGIVSTSLACRISYCEFPLSIPYTSWYWFHLLFAQIRWNYNEWMFF
jgi:hypothetical protein